ncbi:MAG: GAF domain-containing sensor histidine kinase, partial [Chloroflexota bacterium]
VQREDIKVIYKTAQALGGTLNYQRVLDIILDMAGEALSTNHPQDNLVSALCLFDSGKLMIGSARNFSPEDFKTSLPGKQGLIFEALATENPKLSDNPGNDPELRRFDAIRNCKSAFCVPLPGTQEDIGALLFAHPDLNFFNQSRQEALEIIGSQVIIALQHARIYRDLVEEKDRLAEIQEGARKKLARDLHDGPTQSVAAIAMRVNFARRLIERDVKSAGDELYKIEKLARQTTQEIRHMLFTLRPLILETEGLIGALKSMAQKMNEMFNQNVSIKAESQVVESLDLDRQAVIFYIAEEAVNNARKHAEAEHIWVSVEPSEKNIAILEVRDDGVGFNVGGFDTGNPNPGSLGMVNMRERTELLKGVFHLNAEEGQGTRIRVWIPLTDDAVDSLRRDSKRT